MAVKNYGIHDQWTNLDKLNNVDIKSVDGVVESVKINGEEAGGGSSDITEIELIIDSRDDEWITPNLTWTELYELLNGDNKVVFSWAGGVEGLFPAFYGIGVAGYDDDNSYWFSISTNTNLNLDWESPLNTDKPYFEALA